MSDKRDKAHGREITDPEELLRVACQMVVVQPHADRLHAAIVAYVEDRIRNHDHLTNARIG